MYSRVHSYECGGVDELVPKIDGKTVAIAEKLQPVISAIAKVSGSWSCACVPGVWQNFIPRVVVPGPIVTSHHFGICLSALPLPCLHLYTVPLHRHMCTYGCRYRCTTHTNAGA